MPPRCHSALRVLRAEPPGLDGRCTYADAPFGSVNLRVGSFGPLEIVKADTESLEVLEDPLNFLSK